MRQNKIEHKPATEEQYFTCAVFEALNKYHKTQLYFDENLYNKQQLEKVKFIENKKDRIKAIKYYEDEIKENKKIIARAEKYNQELINTLKRQNKHLDIDEIILNVTDYYTALNKLIIERCKDVHGYKVALLEESENGNIFVDSNKYKIHT